MGSYGDVCEGGGHMVLGSVVGNRLRRLPKSSEIIDIPSGFKVSFTFK